MYVGGCLVIKFFFFFYLQHLIISHIPNYIILYYVVCQHTTGVITVMEKLLVAHFCGLGCNPEFCAVTAMRLIHAAKQVTSLQIKTQHALTGYNSVTSNSVTNSMTFFSDGKSN